MTAGCSSKAPTMANLNLPDNIDSLCGPEKLVICVDSACLNMDFKKMLRNFLETKTIVNQHEIALAMLTGNDVNFLCDFQTDVKSVSNQLWDKNKSYTCYSRQTFDFSRLFKQICQRVATFKNDATVTLRVIILYARIDCVPIIENDAPLAALQKAFPYFTLDVLYMPLYSQTCGKGRKEKERQEAREIFKSLIALCNPKSYIFVVEEPANPLPFVLKFLAHPALRENQKADWFE